jgi:hypothetical protein
LTCRTLESKVGTPNRMASAAPQLALERTWPFIAALLVITFVAFWPTYFAPGLSSSSFYVHLHAITAASWMILLIIQPLLIRRYNFDAHRAAGRISYVLVPILLVSMVLLANYRLRSVPEEVYRLQTYVLYLQFSLAGLFAISFILATIYKKEAEVHARFMICTALTLIDPVFARAFFWMDPKTVEYHQYLTYGLTDLLFLVLIFLERRNSRERWVFPLMLAVFVLMQIPALLWLTDWPAWQSVASWFRSLALT